MGAEDIFAVMASRRSCRRFTPRPVEMDKVLQIVQAAALAPSSGNIQNWTYIVVTDIDTIRALYHHSLDQEPFLSAMSAIIVCGDMSYARTMYGMRGKRLYTVQNCAAAIQNALLAAEAIGLGACWIGAFDEDKIVGMFGVPSDKHRPQAIILLGYSDYTPEPKETKLLDGIVFFNKFGNRVKRPHLVYFDWATEWQNVGKKVRRQLDWAKWEMEKRKEKGEEPEEAADEDAKPPETKESKIDQLKELQGKTQESFKGAGSKIRDILSSLKKDEHRKK